MGCRDAFKVNGNQSFTTDDSEVYRLLFGVDSQCPANTVLQNNLTMFEWVERNKVYPNFWGRNILGDHSLTKREIDFLHGKACKVIPVCEDMGPMESEDEAKFFAKVVNEKLKTLEIAQGTAVFVKVGESSTVTTWYLQTLAEEMLSYGYIPGFKANTDAKFIFDREYSRGMQMNPDLFSRCLVWALAPTLEEYDGITTTHLIHPDNWVPYAPSGITRRDIAVWRYGEDCHPIYDNNGEMTMFDIHLVRNEQVIVHAMY